MVDKKNNKTLDTFDKIAAAYHEAAHLLVAEILSVGSVGEARIIKTRGTEDQWHGYVRYCDSFIGATWTPIDFRSFPIVDAMISIAGKEGEYLITGDSDIHGIKADMKHYKEDMHIFYERSPKIRMLLAQPSRFTPNINRAKVLRKAHDDHAEKDLEIISHFTRQLLKDNLEYLHLLAENLYKKRKLKREDIDALLNEEDYNRICLREFGKLLEYYCEYPERIEQKRWRCRCENIKQSSCGPIKTFTDMDDESVLLQTA